VTEGPLLIGLQRVTHTHTARTAVIKGRKREQTPGAGMATPKREFKLKATKRNLNNKMSSKVTHLEKRQQQQPNKCQIEQMHWEKRL